VTLVTLFKRRESCDVVRSGDSAHTAEGLPLEKCHCVTDGANSKSKPTAHPYESWSPLEKFLVTWAAKHWPEPLDAIWNRLDDSDYVRRCFGSIFRRCCYRDPSWLWRVIEWDAAQVLRLSPFIGELEWARLVAGTVPGVAGTIPGRMGWRAWIDAARKANVIAWREKYEREARDKSASAVSRSPSA
jgi:hypothetical protein